MNVLKLLSFIAKNERVLAHFRLSPLFVTEGTKTFDKRKLPKQFFGSVHTPTTHISAHKNHNYFEVYNQLILTVLSAFPFIFLL